MQFSQQQCFQLNTCPLHITLHAGGCLIHYLEQLQNNGMEHLISPSHWFNNNLPFSVPLSVPIPLLHCLPLSLFYPLPILSCLPTPLPIHSSLPIPVLFSTTLRFLLVLAVVIVLACATTSPSTARCTAIWPVLFIIILVTYFIPIQWSNLQEVAWLVLLSPWRFNLALRLSLLYDEKCSLASLICPELFLCWLERSTRSLQAWRLSHL